MQDVTDDPQYAAIRCLGIQRGKRFLFRLCSTVEMPGTLDPLVEVSRDDIREVLVPVDLAESSSESKELDDICGRLSDRTRKSYKRHRYIRDVVLEEFRGAPPAISIRLFGRTGVGYFLIPWFSEQLSLSIRLPQSADEFKRYLTFKKGRSIDAQTVLGSCRDIVQLNSDSKNSDLYGYIVNSFVMYAYKSIELGVAEGDSFIDQALPDVLKLKDGVLRGAGVREDPDQIALSLHTALWHLDVHRGRTAHFSEQLEALERLYEQIGDSFKLTYALNLSKSSLILAAMRGFSGDTGRCRDGFRRVHEIFKRAAVSNTRSSIQLNELKIAHRCTMLALDGSEQIRKTGELRAGFSRDVAECAARVSSEYFVSRLSDAILSAGREPSSEPGAVPAERRTGGR